ncbi:hydroxyacylglutathione hydrolase-like protein isoform X1 [Pezoporus wallicus]|uniref:hydroxyacylglutathione hydrolase-like protein isoform X1 n=1 Tax=Pezoporus wallicus TaxID=35540 RepID=UPI00254A2957|nr:hydroxyacylglutathione hydrolase-like protein isoform X1 [Pezoporus wallicus]
MKVKVISVLEDNYMYLVIEESTRDAIAVDAAVPKRLLEIIRKEDVVLRAILTTHHHWDHARGNEELARLCPGLHVYGADERIGALTHKVTHEQELMFGAIRVRCLFTPCHTSGHVCYFMWEDGSPDAPALFSGMTPCNLHPMGTQDMLCACCLSPHPWERDQGPLHIRTPFPAGDTLFVGGCGKFFEGTAEQMYTNLTQILGALPEETKVFCGHEYTVRNLKFALKVEPENEIVKKKLAWAKQRDDEDLPTVPSTLQEEFLYNPFLRVTEEAVQKFTGKTDPVEVLRTLRTEKDNFKKPKERPNPQAMLAFDWGLFSAFLEKK